MYQKNIRGQENTLPKIEIPRINAAFIELYYSYIVFFSLFFFITYHLFYLHFSLFPQNVKNEVQLALLLFPAASN